MAVYMISDTHFGHSNICRYRPFENIDEHDGTILENILNVVGKRDSLYILGDTCVHREGWWCIEAIAERVEHLHVVLGNHDMERKKHPTIEEYASICKGIYGMRRYKNAWLTHGPLHPEELRGRLNVHGHTHSISIEDDCYVNVSCENTGYFPINFVDIQNGWRRA